jgi:DNA-binding NarL/FixJ family response regulator
MSKSVRDHEKKKDRVIELIGKGLDNDVIAERLGLRMHTISAIRKEVSSAK